MRYGTQREVLLENAVGVGCPLLQEEADDDIGIKHEGLHQRRPLQIRDFMVSPGSNTEPRAATLERHCINCATASAACVVVALCDGPK